MRLHRSQDPDLKSRAHLTAYRLRSRIMLVSCRYILFSGLFSIPNDIVQLIYCVVQQYNVDICTTILLAVSVECDLIFNVN